MQISQTSAMKIVTEINSIINRDVNMMDDKGIIIASTDRSRLGTYHAGAKKLIQDSLCELIISTDDQYEGTKKGINLPILIEGDIVGVIGVTGKWEEVGKYGQIIKKMTEILLLDTYTKDQKRIRADIRNQFIEDWLFDDSKNNNEMFAERGLRLGIDITLPRQVMIVAVKSEDRYLIDSVTGQQMARQVEEAVNHIVRSESANVYYKSAFKLACIISQRSDEKLRQLAERISGEVEQVCGFRPAIGIDSSTADCRQMYQAYSRAEKAMKAALCAGGGNIRFYSDINLEIFINEIPSVLRGEFIHKVFRQCTDEEIDQWISILNVYFECNGSINQCSQQLYLHKNTIQYKLRKLSECTGYDPRNLSDAALYYIAMAFYNSLAEEVKLGRPLKAYKA